MRIQDRKTKGRREQHTEQACSREASSHQCRSKSKPEPGRCCHNQLRNRSGNFYKSHIWKPGIKEKRWPLRWRVMSPSPWAAGTKCCHSNSNLGPDLICRLGRKQKSYLAGLSGTESGISWRDVSVSIWSNNFPKQGAPTHRTAGLTACL